MLKEFNDLVDQHAHKPTDAAHPKPAETSVPKPAKASLPPKPAKTSSLWLWMKKSPKLLRFLQAVAAAGYIEAHGGKAVKIPENADYVHEVRKRAEERARLKGRETTSGAGSDPPKGRGHSSSGGKRYVSGSEAARELKALNDRLGVQQPVKGKAGGGSLSPKMRGSAPSGLKIGGNILVTVALWWLESWLQRKINEAERARAEKLISSKLEPAVVQAIIDASPMIDDLTAKVTSEPLYANITADFDYYYVTMSTGIQSERLEDVRFIVLNVSGKDISNSKVTKRKRVIIEPDLPTAAYWVTRRVTYSLLVFHPEYEKEKARRLSAYDKFVANNPWARIPVVTGEAAEEISHGRWVRAITEVQDFFMKRKIDELKQDLGLISPPSRS